MKKLLSLILAVAMMMTIFCVVPVSAEDTPSNDISNVYFFTDFAEDADGVYVTAGNGNGASEYAADKGINGTGALKLSVDSGKYTDLAFTDSVMSGREVNLPVGAKVQLKAKVKFETTPASAGAALSVVATTNNGSNAWGTGTTIPAATATTQWHDITLTTGARATTAGATTVEFRMTNSSASADGNRHVFYLDEVELKVIYAAGSGFAAPTITSGSATNASDGSLNLTYNYAESGETSGIDASIIKVYDGTTFLGKYQAGGSFTIPLYNRASENLKAVITPISGWGYLNPTDVTVTIPAAHVETTNISSVYYFNNFSEGIDGITVHANGSTAYAADKGVNGTGALKLTVTSGKYGNIRIPVFMPEYKDIPQGAKIVLKAKVKYESTMTSNISFSMISQTSSSNGNAWGTGATIPLATSKTQWTDITMTSATQQSTLGANTRFEFRLNGGATTSDGSNAVFYLDDLEMKIVYAGSAELAAPTITDARAAAAADGSVYVEYTFASNGTTTSTIDNSVIKVYDGDICLGTTKKGTAFVVPAERRESANLSVAITPISGWRYIGTTDVTCAVGTRNGYYDYIETVADTATAAGVQIATSVNNAALGSTVVLKAVCADAPADAKVMIYEGATMLAESALTASSAVEVSTTLTADAADLKFYVGGAEGAFTLDDVEIKILKDTTGVENSLPTVSNVSVLVDKETGVVTADYDYAESGTLAKGDNSVIKVYDGDVCLGAFVLGGSFTVPAENKTSGNLGIKVVPISLWGYFDDEVSALIPFCINPEITWAGNTASATVEVTVNDIAHELNSAEIIAILAVYDSEGIMVAAPSIATIGASDSHSQTLVLSGVTEATATVAKVFVWNGTSLDDAGSEIYNSAVSENK